MDILIRKMTPKDSSYVADLSAELGYPASKETIESRITRLLDKADHYLLVACKECHETEVFGWIHIRINEALEVPTHAEITALVVAPAYRGAKIGQRLVEAGEAWCSREVDSIQLRSKISRTEAHRFYERLDYKITKTSHLFVKTLPSASMP